MDDKDKPSLREELRRLHRERALITRHIAARMAASRKEQKFGHKQNGIGGRPRSSPVLNMTQACHLLRLSPNSIRKLLRDGKLPDLHAHSVGEAVRRGFGNPDFGGRLEAEYETWTRERSARPL